MPSAKTTINELKTLNTDLLSRIDSLNEQLRDERSEHVATLQFHRECQAELAAAQHFRDDLVDQLISAWMEERTRAQQHQHTLEYARTILARPGVATHTDADLRLALADNNPPF